MPVQRYDVDGIITPVKGTSFLGGFAYPGFDRGSVRVYSGGLGQYLAPYLYISYQFFYSRDFNNLSSYTHLGKIAFLKERKFHFTLGYADCSEAYKEESLQETRNIYSKTGFLSLRYWLKYYMGVTLNGSYAWRKDSYDTWTIGGGILFSF